ncbi:MAG: amidohydrolase family protein, partial [Oscillospiraceae bacterium]|nr:amidohydrolase family protein [Oscillospiraceae bacterium]
MSLLFRDATIVQADGRVLSACLGVEGERITHIGVGEGQWDSVIDASSLILIPGLVNAHTHAAMNLLRGAGDDMPLHDWLFDRIFPLEETLTGDDIYRGAQAAIAEMLAGGVTSFTDMYYFCDRLLEAVEESGIKCNIGRGVTSGEALDEADKLFFLPHSDRVRFDIAPHAEYTTSPALLRRCAAVAKAHGARAHIHASE